jgi:ABC-type polysaccharide/polyol phosphate transport system ATPase subunit
VLPPSARPEAQPVVLCDEVAKRFYYYEHRTTSLRELFRRRLMRRPAHVRHPSFALSGFNLRVAAGEAVALVGSNGSGKSTVLRLLAGIYRPTSGVVEVRGRIGAVIELGAGFHPELTGAENVHLYAALLGLGRREVNLRYPQILEFAGVGDFIGMPVKYYSSGMQARLAFAVAVCIEPDVLLLDEVLAVGDREFRERCTARLHAFRARGGTLIAVSHDLDAAAEICSRAVWIDRGQVRMEGEIEEVTRAYRAE